MQLTVSETARLLNVDEKTVEGWIRKKGLPARRVNEKYRLNRVDLLEWATDQGLKLSPEIFAATDDDTIVLPMLSQALEVGGIHYGVKGGDSLTVLGNVVALLDLPPQIDPEFLLQVLLAREALGTTAIGDGIAIPHVRNPILMQVGSPAITLCFLEQPIDFQALDGKPVHILFTLISPTAKTHLHLLAKLAYALRDPRFKAVLGRPENPGKILETVRLIESELGSR
jgi:nitrogen PTS system EIIA component